MSGGTQRREKTKDPASIDRVDPKDLKIAYVGGGSRLWSRTLINDLAQTETLSGDVYLYDIDYSSAKKMRDSEIKFRIGRTFLVTGHIPQSRNGQMD